MTTGLMVTGRTIADNTAIGEFVEKSNSFFAEWDARGGHWFFPEEIETYDTLEMELEREFLERGIDARFEGVFFK